MNSNRLVKLGSAFLLGLLIVMVVFSFVLQEDSTGARMEEGGRENRGSEQVKEEEVMNYIRYTQQEFEKARGEKKVVVLYFDANWCPICAEQRPINRAVFKELENENLIGLVVAFNDSETNEDDEGIAREYGVAYQHTFVVIDEGGEEVYRHTGLLGREELVEGIREVL